MVQSKTNATSARREHEGRSSYQNQQQSHHQQQTSQQDEQKTTESVSLDDINKAIVEVAALFTSQGVSLVGANTTEGTIVKFQSADGRLIRQVSGREFMELKASSHLDKLTRGKVLDQKF